MTMTPRERIQAALEHREPDRTPIFEYVLLSPAADQLFGRPYALDPGNWPAVLDELGWEAAVRQIAIDRLDLALLLGHDMMYVYHNPLPGRRDVGLHVAPADLSPDPVAALAERNQAEEGVQDLAPDDALLVYVFVREEMERRGVDLPVLAPGYVHGIWSDVDLMVTMLLAPEVAHRHFALATRRALARIAKYIELGIDIVGLGGDFSGNRPMISPHAYRTFILPEVRECSRRAHEAGKWTVNTTDGNLWPILDDFLIGCEVDGYLEIDYHAGMDLRRLKDAFGDRVTFFGNLDCGNILSFGSTEEVRRHVVECLEAGRGNGGHVLCASNAITSSVPLENYVTVVNTYRDFFGLARFP